MKISVGLVIAIISLLSTIEEGNGARILAFFPIPVKSHHRVFQPLLRALAERGHQVTYFTPFKIDKAPASLNHIVIPDNFLKLIQHHNTVPGFLQDVLPVMMGKLSEALAEDVLPSEEFQSLISSNLEFDLIISEITVLHEAFSPLTHRFNAPSIEILPSGNLHYSWFIHGNPYDTSYIIDTSVKYTDHMTLWQKIHNTFNSVTLRFILYNCFLPKYQRLADEHFRYKGWESRPPLSKLIGNASIVLVNSHMALNYPYPQASNFKDIGGINLQPETAELSKELKQFMDEATDGLIYFTLGSHAQVSSTLSEEQKKTFTQVFSTLKQRILWKWEQEFPNLPNNVRISKWFPQQSILAHKNIKLFLTHGGFLSMTEAVYNGIPMIAIPLMGDQFKNTKHMETFGYGIPLYLNNITVESLTWALNEIIYNKRYSENIKIRSSQFRDKPQTALETAIYWTEYVIRHKGAYHLKPAIASMPWYQQAMLDVYAAIAIMLLTPIYILFCVIRFICGCLFRSKKRKTKRE